MENNLIKLAKEKGFLVEVSTKRTLATDINTLNESLKSFEVSDITVYSIKAIKNDKSINIMVESIDNPEEIIKNLESIYELQENNNKNRLCKESISNELRNTEELDYNKVKESILEMNKYFMNKYKEIYSIETGYSHYHNKYKVENNDATLLDENYFNAYGVGITIKKNNVNKSFFNALYTRNFDINLLKEKIEDDIKRTIIKLDCDSCKTDRYKIILKNDVAAGLLNTFSSMFESKMIDLKESVLQDKFGKKVFSNKITIVEDPNSDNTIIKKAFDGEGTKTCYKEIIKDGVFIKKINDLEYAIKNNEEPTGNSYGVNNLYIKPGNTSYDELIKELNNGIIIDDLIGFHAGVDFKNGNISLQAEGLVVKDGKIISGLGMIILATNLFELFNNIIDVGSDLSTSSADVNSPSLLIDNITITGKK